MAAASTNFDLGGATYCIQSALLVVVTLLSESAIGFWTTIAVIGVILVEFVLDDGSYTIAEVEDFVF